MSRLRERVEGVLAGSRRARWQSLRRQQLEAEVLSGLVGELEAALRVEESLKAMLAAVVGRAELAELRLRVAVDAIDAPYPEEIFTPFTEDERTVLFAAMRDSGVRYPTERLYAAWARERRAAAEFELGSVTGEGEGEGAGRVPSRVA